MLTRLSISRAQYRGALSRTLWAGEAMVVKMQFICNRIQHCLNLSGIVLQGNSEFIRNSRCEVQEVIDTCTCWCVCWSWYEIEVLCANSKWEQASWWSKTTLQWCGWLDPTNYFLHWRSWYIDTYSTFVTLKKKTNYWTTHTIQHFLNTKMCSTNPKMLSMFLTNIRYAAPSFHCSFVCILPFLYTNQ